MTINFLLTGNYALNYKGRHLDLHNNFDFFGLEYKVEEQSLILKWLKGAGEWVPENELEEIVLIHKQVNYLNVQPRDHLMPKTEDTCLSEISFFPTSDRHINDSVIDRSLPNVDDDILYHFQSGLSIR